ncbi:7386_t:CDS:2 [Racocetra fulgida]|uniref:7386_t:CDS:1 n=1 Tax=Racocetra fulgida TaxID=60492 RepID=A0A9N8ZES4_9GLOM|nr:7386_t:CDS:2 [Racocetra fulgida]
MEQTTGLTSEFADTALKAIEDVSDELYEISIKNPELAYEEKFAHKLLVDYLKEKGFKVTPSAFGLETAFLAEFQSKAGKEIGHACGHNLIAISGVGAAIGLKAVLEKFNIEGIVNGKVDLIKAGAYEGVDVSLMVHPRIHGIITNGGQAPNTGSFLVRGKTMKDLEALQPRVHKCFEAASDATGAKAKITWRKAVPEDQNNAFSGSTDQGNVTHLVPGFHPVYDIRSSIPAVNHQREFASACRTKTAHEETIKATSGMTLVGLDFLIDEEFAKQVKESFDKSKL